MRILIVHLNRDRYSLEVIADWLELQGHEVVRYLTPTREQVKEYKPGVFHVEQMTRTTWNSTFSGIFDLAISTEPYSIISLLGPRLLHRIKKLVFWRIDYRPSRFLGMSRIFNTACRLADETWSVAPLSRKERYVPVLLDDFDFKSSSDNLPSRENSVIFAGPDLENLTPILAAVDHQLTETYHSIKWLFTDWRSSQVLSKERVRDLFFTQKIGLTLHRGNLSEGNKQYSDPSRSKRYLAAGLPVITTWTYPFAREIKTLKAGIVVDLTPASIVAGIRWCLEHWDEMHDNALELAEKYRISERWIQV